MNFTTIRFLERIANPVLSTSYKIRIIYRYLASTKENINDISHPLSNTSILHYVSDITVLNKVLALKKNDGPWKGYYDQLGLSPIFRYTDNLIIVQEYYNNNFDLNKVDITRDRSILFFSSSSEVINFALRKGLDINQPDNQGITPLQDALNKQDYKKAIQIINACEELNINLLVENVTQLTIYNLILNHVQATMSDIPGYMKYLHDKLCANNFVFYPEVFARLIQNVKHDYFEYLHNANSVLFNYYFSSQENNLTYLIYIIKQLNPFIDEYTHTFSEDFAKHIFKLELIIAIIREKNQAVAIKDLVSQAIKINCVETFRNLINKIGYNEIRDIFEDNSLLVEAKHRPDILFDLFNFNIFTAEDIYDTTQQNVISLAIQNEQDFMAVSELIDKNHNIINAPDMNNLTPLSHAIKQYLDAEDQISRSEKLIVIVCSLKNGAIPRKENFYEFLSKEHGIEVLQIFKQFLGEHYNPWLEQMDNKRKVQTIHIDYMDNSLENLTSNKIVTHLLIFRQPEHVIIDIVRSQKTARDQNLLLLVYLSVDLIPRDFFAAMFDHLINPFERFDLGEILERNKDYHLFSSILNSFEGSSLTEYILDDSILELVGQKLLNKLVYLTKQQSDNFDKTTDSVYAQDVFDFICYTLKLNLKLEPQRKLIKNIYKIHELVMKAVTEDMKNNEVAYFLK